MPIQSVLSALIVAAAFLYAVWALMPGAGRLAVQRRMGLAPKRAGSTTGCRGCNGCDGGSATSAGQAQPVKLYRRPRPDGSARIRRG